MEIVVNDTQVLIDMYDADLLGLVERCSIKFHTVDYVMAELHRSPYNRPEIDQMVKDGILRSILSVTRRTLIWSPIMAKWPCKQTFR